MQRFSCGRCGAEVPFDADHCGACSTSLGYLAEACVLRVCVGDGGVWAVEGIEGDWLRCLNHAWGCNWMLRAETGAVWCASCGLTRGRPDTAVPRAVAAWASVERSKRRVVHQLLALGLPIRPEHLGDPLLVFDLVDMTSGGGVTGHLDGVVTVDLREADDTYRDELRRQLGEEFRTVIGHLRHEVGHHFFRVLVRSPDDLAAARARFGDERSNYAASLERRYSTPMQGPEPAFVTSYAMAHPSEDWAETFAHYLHLRDGLETALAFQLSPAVDACDAPIRELVGQWSTVVRAVTAISDGLGQPRPFPRPTTDPDLLAKFDLIHRLISTYERRGGPDELAEASR